MQKPKLGYHLILDLQECKENLVISQEEYDRWMNSCPADGLLPKTYYEIKDSIYTNGLTCVSGDIHIFDNGSWSCCYLLSESHLAIHTWPEFKYVSADVFVCNYSEDNRSKADRLSEFLIDFFKAGKINLQRIERS